MMMELSDFSMQLLQVVVIYGNMCENIFYMLCCVLYVYR